MSWQAQEDDLVLLTSITTDDHQGHNDLTKGTNRGRFKSLQNGAVTRITHQPVQDEHKLSTKGRKGHNAPNSACCWFVAVKVPTLQVQLPHPPLQQQPDGGILRTSSHAHPALQSRGPSGQRLPRDGRTCPYFLSPWFLRLCHQVGSPWSPRKATPELRQRQVGRLMPSTRLGTPSPRTPQMPPPRRS